MAWIIVVLVAVALVIYRIRKSSGNSLLRATIATPDGATYTVHYEMLHPEVQPVEYVRLILMFASKLLYIMGHDPNHASNKARLLSSIATLARSTLDSRTDVLALCAARGVEVHESATPGSGKQIEVVLGFVDLMNRSVRNSLPATWYPNQLTDSWLALVQTSLPKLDSQMRSRLQGSLSRLDRMYSAESVGSSSLKALVTAPNQAFIEADVV